MCKFRWSFQSKTKKQIDSHYGDVGNTFGTAFCCQAQPNLPGPLMPPIGRYLPTQQLKVPVRVLGLKRLFLTLSLLDQRNSLRNDVPLRILEFCVKKKTTKPFIPHLLDVFKTNTKLSRISSDLWLSQSSRKEKLTRSSKSYVNWFYEFMWPELILNEK